MPAYLTKNQKRLTTYQANKSRFVTKCRWVVEAVKARLKVSFKALSKIRNFYLPTIIRLSNCGHSDQ